LAEAVRSVFAGDYVFDDLAAAPCDVQLTARRLDILRMAARGQSNKRIANQLHITERTVKDHWTWILAQLGASNRTQAVTLALQQGFIRVDD